MKFSPPPIYQSLNASRRSAAHSFDADGLVVVFDDPVPVYYLVKVGSRIVDLVKVNVGLFKSTADLDLSSTG